MHAKALGMRVEICRCWPICVWLYVETTKKQKGCVLTYIIVLPRKVKQSECKRINNGMSCADRWQHMNNRLCRAHGWDVKSTVCHARQMGTAKHPAEVNHERELCANRTGEAYIWCKREYQYVDSSSNSRRSLVTHPNAREQMVLHSSEFESSTLHAQQYSRASARLAMEQVGSYAKWGTEVIYNLQSLDTSNWSRLAGHSVQERYLSDYLLLEE